MKYKYYFMLFETRANLLFALVYPQTLIRVACSVRNFWFPSTHWVFEEANTAH